MELFCARALFYNDNLSVFVDGLSSSGKNKISTHFTSVNFGSFNNVIIF